MEEDRNKNIRGYQMMTELSSKNSGFGRWGFAQKDGKEYFIKEFLSPVYPDETLEILEEERRKRIQECQKFCVQKINLYESIRRANNGNIIQIDDFFRWGTHYYITTEKVNDTSLGIEEIAKLPVDKKEVLLRVLAHCLVNLSRQGVVHGDLKPDNILIKQTDADFYTSKLIDFDSSFMENTIIEEPDEIQGDVVYMAPETFLCIAGENDRISVKADVFSLGLIFHQYWSGKLPFWSEEYDYMYEVALDQAEYELHPSVPDIYQALIRNMLVCDPEKRISIEGVLDILSGKKPSEDLRFVELGEKNEINDSNPGVIDDSWGAEGPVLENGLKISANLRRRR